MGTTKAPETMQLEFKRGGMSGRDLNDDTRAALARALSGYANTEGGLLVFGIDARADADKIDRVSSLPLVDAGPFLAAIQRVVRDSAEPPIAGVDVAAFVETTGATQGVVAVFVPQSDGGPHRARGCRADFADRYFIRGATGFGVMPHPLLAAMFGRLPQPRLRLKMVYQADDRGEPRLSISMCNDGRGWANRTLFRFGFVKDGRPYHGKAAQWARGWEMLRTGQAHRMYELPIPPEDEVPVITLGLHGEVQGDDEMPTIHGRIYCEGAPPVDFEQRVPDLGAKPVAFPATE